MTSLSFPEDGSASLVLGLAIVLVSCIPIWALLLWMAASSLSWRWRAEMSWKRFVVPIAGFAAVIAGGYGWSFAGRLFAQSRFAERDVIYWTWVVQLFVAGVAVVVVASARASSETATVSAVRRTKRGGGVVVLAWGVLALVLAVLRSWPFRGDSARFSDWCALATSSAILVAIIVLLIIAVVDVRKDTARRHPCVGRNTR